MRLSHRFQKENASYMVNDRITTIHCLSNELCIEESVFAGEEKGMQFPMHWAKDVYCYYGDRISGKENVPIPGDRRSVLAVCRFAGRSVLHASNCHVPFLDHRCGVVGRLLKTRRCFLKVTR